MAEDKLTNSGELVCIKEEVGKREAAKLVTREHLAMKNEERLRLRKIRNILRKEVSERNSDDVEFLCRYPKVVNELVKRKEKRKQITERMKEVPCLNKFNSSFISYISMSYLTYSSLSS